MGTAGDMAGRWARLQAGCTQRGVHNRAHLMACTIMADLRWVLGGKGGAHSLPTCASGDYASDYSASEIW